MSPLQAHAACIALVFLDFLVRAWRVAWIMRGLGTPLTLREAFVANAFGDAANALTPLRLGGEPARLAGLLRSGAGMTAALVGITLEAIASRVVLIAVGAWLIWRYAPEWWQTAGPDLQASAMRAWPWVAVALIAGLLIWWYVRRVVSPATTRMRRPLQRILMSIRGMPPWPLLASLPLSVAAMAARIAILPLLLLTLPHPPSAAAMIFGSFALLYSQMVLPTPSGAGVVEVGFLGGAAGQVGEGQGRILFAWRAYTNGIGIVLGIYLALSIYGWPLVRKLFRGNTRRVSEQDA
jgi:uncharacterized membrane protein YbhN (UPF0104 family)